MKTKPPRKKAQPEFPGLTGEPAGTLTFIIATIGIWVLALFVFATEVVPTVWSAHTSATSWRKTQGHIIQSEWSYKPGFFPGELIRRRQAQIVYRYSVDGREFEGSQVELIEFTSRSDSREELRRYPEGSQVTVYYQPDDPANAALRTGLRQSTLLAVLFGIACCCWILHFTARGSWIGFQRYRLRSLKLPSKAV